MAGAAASGGKQVKVLNASLMFPDERMPLVVEPAPRRTSLDEFVHAHWRELEAALLEHGAVLLRGFDVRSVEDFSRCVEATGLPRLDYLYRSTPRTEVADKIFTTTEYPPAQEIVLHNENAYQREWPLKVAFCCLVPASSGGETPLGDMRRISAAIGPQLTERFAARGVCYVRHYRRHIDLPWQVVFQAEAPEQAAAFCREHGIEHEWLDEQTLRTSQRAQGTAAHPATGEQVYFNQAHLFHSSSLGAAAAESLIKLFGADRLPRHACYGDGEQIDPADLEHIRTVFRRHEICFPWRSGDVLLLDNMQAAHGRRPFRGPRKVLAALLQAYSCAAPPQRRDQGETIEH